MKKNDNIKSKISNCDSLNIDKKSLVPLYFQIKRFFEHKILSGEMKPGDQFPTEAELCECTKVSRSVERQALKELEDDGLIWRTAGRGTFVSQKKLSRHTLRRLRGFFRDVRDEGLVLKSKILDLDFIQVFGKISKILQIEEGASVLFMNRLRYINDEPMVISRTYVPVNHIPSELANEDLENNFLYEILEDKYGYEISRSHRIVEATTATKDEASLLNINKGVGLILVKTTSYLKDNTPFEYDIGLHRGDRIRFELDVYQEQANHIKYSDNFNINFI